MKLTVQKLREANGTFRSGNILIEDGDVKAVAITTFGTPMKVGDTVSSVNFDWRVYDKDTEEYLEIDIPEFEGVVRNIFETKRLTAKGQMTFVNYLRIL